MPIINRIAEFHNDMAGWRHDIHAHPETAFEERRTAKVVADTLAGLGIEIHTGLAKTGVVGVLRNGGSDRAIGLRADMDALHIHEKTQVAYRSTDEGKMHACGHDGHTAMLLGAAKYLAETKRFDGTVYFIFQPAEENEGGGRVMVEEGLFDRFPMNAVYGMHNWPGLPVGEFAIRPGPMMAAADRFEIEVEGKGTHAAMPHLGRDPIVVAAEIVSALQTIASRATDPQDAIVVSITQIHGGDTWNVIPDTVVLRGTARAFRREVHENIEPTLRRIATGIAHAHGVGVELRYIEGYPATVNSVLETELAAEVAGKVAGADRVRHDPVPSMGAEDFAFLLQKKPGAYIWVGNGGTEGGCLLHNPHYDFNDEALPIGASYWATLVETALPKT